MQCYRNTKSFLPKYQIDVTEIRNIQLAFPNLEKPGSNENEPNELQNRCVETQRNRSAKTRKRITGTIEIRNQYRLKHGNVQIRNRYRLKQRTGFTKR